MKIGLLISDDPDDYQMFYEALEEVSENIILINIGVNPSAARYLKENAPHPDFIIIDMSMNETESAEIMTLLRSDSELKLIPKLALVEEQPLDMDSVAGYIPKGADFGDLKNLLRSFLSD